MHRSASIDKLLLSSVYVVWSAQLWNAAHLKWSRGFLQPLWRSLARLSPLNITPAPAIRWDDLASKTGADWAKFVAMIMDSVKLRSQAMHGTGIGALIDYMKKILYTIFGVFPSYCCIA